MKENDLDKLIDKLKQVAKLFNYSMQDHIYSLECANTIWLRCPFSVGDRVVLTMTPEITEEKRWGWMGAKHFLVKGAVATVAEREFYDGTFKFGLKFDDDSWINSTDGSINPIEEKNRGLYYFSEKNIERKVD